MRPVKSLSNSSNEIATLSKDSPGQRGSEQFTNRGGYRRGGTDLDGIRNVVVVTAKVMHPRKFRLLGPRAPRTWFSFVATLGHREADMSSRRTPIRSVDLDAAEFVPDAPRQGGVTQPETAGQRRQHQGNARQRCGPRPPNGRHDAAGRRAGCCAAGHARGRRQPSRGRRRRTQASSSACLAASSRFKLLHFAARGRLGQRRRGRAAAVQFLLRVA